MNATGPDRAPYVTCLKIGLGGLFFGVTGPLLSNFVPILVRDALGEHRTAIGSVMAIDNVLLLALVPWAGAVSDRASARGRGRLPIVLAGLVLAAAGMALFPWSATFGIAGLIAAMVVLYTGINVLRSPFQALVAELVPSRYRSIATGSVTFQMCVGAIVFLMLGGMLGFIIGIPRRAVRPTGCRRGRHRPRIGAAFGEGEQLTRAVYFVHACDKPPPPASRLSRRRSSACHALFTRSGSRHAP